MHVRRAPCSVPGMPLIFARPARLVVVFDAATMRPLCEETTMRTTVNGVVTLVRIMTTRTEYRWR